MQVRISEFHHIYDEGFFISPGYYSYINLSSTYQRLFYLPSEECHNQGLAVIREVTDLLKNKTLDLEEKHWRIDDIYIRKCYTTSTLGTSNMTKVTTAFPSSAAIISSTGATTTSSTTLGTVTKVTPTFATTPVMIYTTAVMTTSSTTQWSILTESTETTETSTPIISPEATLKLDRKNETETYTWIIIYYLATLCIFLTITVFCCFICQLITAKKYFTFKNSKVHDVSLNMKEDTILTQINI